MKKIGLFLFISVASLLFISGCGGSKETASDHGLELPNGVESHLPLPAEAHIAFQHEDGNTYSIMYQPGVSYPDAIEFFSERLSTDGWTLVSEDIPDRTEGERTAGWEAEGHGVEVTVTLTAFGGPDGFNMTGFIMITKN
ncbi:hypothetical protein [Evansella tamaricis]|uniref:Lipoprotein n=1 Tax=Evansella tamaricis TaxID=2069301 RepID=A0ABS6JHF6_9BACI|nr:hypothetical protein [Evansella tamaricis]MBU9713061.1 hypothetical protein [Evansella tamaricis]